MNVDEVESLFAKAYRVLTPQDYKIACGVLGFRMAGSQVYNVWIPVFLRVCSGHQQARLFASY